MIYGHTPMVGKVEGSDHDAWLASLEFRVSALEEALRKSDPAEAFSLAGNAVCDCEEEENEGIDWATGDGLYDFEDAVAFLDNGHAIREPEWHKDVYVVKEGNDYYRRGLVGEDGELCMDEFWNISPGILDTKWYISCDPL